MDVCIGEGDTSHLVALMSSIAQERAVMMILAWVLDFLDGSPFPEEAMMTKRHARKAPVQDFRITWTFSCKITRNSLDTFLADRKSIG